MKVHHGEAKKCIVVLGCHRSGTSALTGALYQLGVNIGSKYLADLYENKFIVAINSELLQSMGTMYILCPITSGIRFNPKAFMKRFQPPFKGSMEPGPFWL